MTALMLTEVKFHKIPQLITSPIFAKFCIHWYPQGDVLLIAFINFFFFLINNKL